MDLRTTAIQRKHSRVPELVATILINTPTYEEKRLMIQFHRIVVTLFCSLILLLSLTACAAPPAPTPTTTLSPTTAPPAVPTPLPTTAPTVTRTATTAASAATPATKTVNIASLLPAGAGRGLLFDSCSGCHSPLCPVIGQRAAGHWERVKLQHRSELSSMSDADYKTLFDYLSSNFNDTKPEPPIPPEMKQTITCAPF